MHPELPLRTVIASAPLVQDHRTLNVYTNASCRVNTGFGIVAFNEDRVAKVRLYMEDRMDIKRTKTIAVCIAAQKYMQTRSNVVIHTENRLIAHNYDRRDMGMYEGKMATWLRHKDCLAW